MQSLHKLNNQRKLGIIGHFGDGLDFYDGQTVKTRMLYRLLTETIDTNDIVIVDTYDYRHRFPLITAKILYCLFTCNDVFVLLSENGRRVLFPLLSFMTKHFNVCIYHNLIGGWLARNLEKYPKWVIYLNSFKINWVESHELVNELRAKGVNNAQYLPNFKYISVDSIANKKQVGPDYRFCTFSRVMEKKGIGDAIYAVEQVAKRYASGNVTLDIYGSIEDDYQKEFSSLLVKSSHSRYCGCVPPDQSASVISQYDALLFPTKWELEGIPGTIIDALTAGVPIIASKWGYYDEMLEDGVTGLGYEFGKQNELPYSIERFIALGDDVFRMRQSCISKAKQYKPEAVAKKIKAALEE